MFPLVDVVTVGCVTAVGTASKIVAGCTVSELTVVTGVPET
jgi:hypothetical protein